MKKFKDISKGIRDGLTYSPPLRIYINSHLAWSYSLFRTTRNDIYRSIGVILDDNLKNPVMRQLRGNEEV
jgi:hypothetical protein